MGRNHEIVVTWFDEVWNKGNTDHIYKTSDVEMSATGLRGMPLNGPKEFEEFYGLMTRLFENIEIEVLRSVEDGDWVSSLYRVKGKKCGSHELIDTTGNTFIRIKNGKIAEAYEHFNFMGFFEQLGAMPPQSLEICLGGNSVLTAA